MVETQLSKHLLQTAILFFQFTQPFDIRAFHTALFGLPVVERGCADAVLSASIGRLLPRLGFLQDLDDRVVAVACFLHGKSSIQLRLLYWEFPLLTGPHIGEAYCLPGCFNDGHNQWRFYCDDSARFATL